MVQLRLYSTIETVSCCQLPRMAGMDMDWNLKRLGQPFQVLLWNSQNREHQKY